MANITELSTLIARKYAEDLKEGQNALSELPQGKRLLVIHFIVNLLLKEVEDVTSGEKDIAEAPFAAIVDGYYEELRPHGCYFCDTGIDGNAEPFDFPKTTKLCLTCRIKVANLLQAFGIAPTTLFPGMPERPVQPRKFAPWKPGEGVH